MQYSLLCRPLVFALLLPIVLAACGTTKPSVYPKASPLTVIVSRGTVDLNTEVPGNDYLIPDSQVFVGGRDSRATSAIAGGFGVLGAAVGMSINRTRNAAGLEGTENAFKLNFAALQSEAFLRAAESRAPGRFTATKSSSTAQLVFIPSVRITFGEEEDAYVSYRAKVEFLDGESAAEKGKNFFYADFERRRILGEGGWSADDAQALRVQANKSMGIISEVILDDVGGKLQPTTQPENSRFVMLRVKNQNTPPMRALMLKEYPDYIAVAPAPKERAFPSVVNIYAINSVEITPAQ